MGDGNLRRLQLQWRIVRLPRTHRSSLPGTRFKACFTSICENTGLHRTCARSKMTTTIIITQMTTTKVHLLEARCGRAQMRSLPGSKMHLQWGRILIANARHCLPPFSTQFMSALSSPVARYQILVATVRAQNSFHATARCFTSIHVLRICRKDILG